MSPEFKRIFEPLKVGSITIPNRLFTSAHHTYYTKEDPEGYHRWGVLSERAAYYHADRAKGGFGLVFMGQTNVHPQSGIHRPGSYPEQAVAPFKLTAELVHQAGGKVMVQLAQNGREKRNSGPDFWGPPWGPSATAGISPDSRGEMVHEMDQDDINSLIEYFVIAARNCIKAGIDGVEVHAAHPHMIGEWLTPQANKRKDKYGGSVENRLRIVIEIMDAIRKAVGREYTVGVRMNGAWPIPGGQTVEESVLMAKILKDTKQVDFLNVSGWPGIGSIGSELGFMMPWVEAVKRAVPDMPVFGVGRIIRPEQAERIVESGQADMVGMTRASIADPELPKKAREGRVDDIRMCIGAGQGCLARNNEDKPIGCTQNATASYEKDWGLGSIKPATTKKKVMVVGGGAAGLEAALIAAQRGHQVTVYERSGSLGGQINLIRKVQRMEEFGHVIDWRRRQLEKLGVSVKLNSEVTAATVREQGPDAVVLATGSRPRRVGWYLPKGEIEHIPGSDMSHVFTVWDVLEGKLDHAKHVAVIDGTGYHQSGDVVEYFAQRNGTKVAAISGYTVFAAGISNNDRPSFMQATYGKPITFYNMTVVNEIKAHEVLATDKQYGRPVKIEGIDAVVVSIGNDINDQLYKQLKGQVKDLHRIGDCFVPRGVEHAVYEGHKLGRSL